MGEAPGTLAHRAEKTGGPEVGQDKPGQSLEGCAGGRGPGKGGRIEKGLDGMLTLNLWSVSMRSEASASGKHKDLVFNCSLCGFIHF